MLIISLKQDDNFLHKKHQIEIKEMQEVECTKSVSKIILKMTSQFCFEYVHLLLKVRASEPDNTQQQLE